MLLCSGVQMVNVVFVALDALHLSTTLLFWNNAEPRSSCCCCCSAPPPHSESKRAALFFILVRRIKLCTISFGVLRFSFIGCIFVCLTFYGDVFQAQIPGILTPD